MAKYRHCHSIPIIKIGAPSISPGFSVCIASLVEAAGVIPKFVWTLNEQNEGVLKGNFSTILKIQKSLEKAGFTSATTKRARSASVCK